MVEILNTFAQKNNLITGACQTTPLPSERLKASPFTPFVSPSIEKRTNPSASLKGATHAIVIGIPSTEDKTKGALPPPPHKGNNPFGTCRCSRRAKRVPPAHCALDPFMRCTVSSLGVDADYHSRAKVLLRELVGELKERYEFKHKILVDSSALDERALAHRAGLGFFGQNGLLISEKFGSRFNIGCLLINPKNESFGQAFSKSLWGGRGNAPTVLNCDTHCSTCNLCIKSCPTGALGGGALDSRRCISYLTQKDELSPEEEKLIAQAGQLYGCDICQDVCPFNAHVKGQITFVNPKEWLTMSDEDFHVRYGHTAMLWRGAEILRRNARIMSAKKIY